MARLRDRGKVIDSKKIIKDIAAAKKELRQGKFYTFEKIFGKPWLRLKKKPL